MYPRTSKKKYPFGEMFSEGGSIYSKKRRARLLEDGVINNEEEGFMEGYEGYFEEEEENISWINDAYPEEVI